MQEVTKVLKDCTITFDYDSLIFKSTNNHSTANWVGYYGGEDNCEELMNCFIDDVKDNEIGSGFEFEYDSITINQPAGCTDILISNNNAATHIIANITLDDLAEIFKDFLKLLI